MGLPYTVPRARTGQGHGREDHHPSRAGLLRRSDRMHAWPDPAVVRQRLGVRHVVHRRGARIRLPHQRQAAHQRAGLDPRDLRGHRALLGTVGRAVDAAAEQAAQSVPSDVQVTSLPSRNRMDFPISKSDPSS